MLSAGVTPVSQNTVRPFASIGHESSTDRSRSTCPPIIRARTIRLVPASSETPVGGVTTGGVVFPNGFGSSVSPRYQTTLFELQVLQDVRSPSTIGTRQAIHTGSAALPRLGRSRSSEVDGRVSTRPFWMGAGACGAGSGRLRTAAVTVRKPRCVIGGSLFRQSARWPRLLDHFHHGVRRHLVARPRHVGQLLDDFG